MIVAVVCGMRREYVGILYSGTPSNQAQQQFVPPSFAASAGRKATAAARWSEGNRRQANQNAESKMGNARQLAPSRY
jgi:hypothetical protein